MLIQVDVDNTLYDSNVCFKKAAEFYGVNWPLEYDHWFGPDYVDTDLKTLLNVFRRGHSKEFVVENRPYPNSAAVLGGLVDSFEDVEIAYVSDRNEAQSKALSTWLDAHGFLYSADQHVVVSKDKRDWMRRMQPDIVIDDRVRTMIMARTELDAQVVSLEFPYNINLKGEIEGIHIVRDWMAVDDVLREKIIPNVREKSLSRSKVNGRD